jgi:Tol biopolymer transport system component/tRNA A-37 threonylcarbamoyl transferase component Bud32
LTISQGTRLGPYEVLSPLGAGGMGEVYKARDTRLERTVAIKVLPQHLSSSEEVRQRFEREAKTISSLSHPHVCALYDVGSQDGVEYLVMEYLEGETLADRLLKGPLPTEQTLRYGIEIADALDKAQRQGIVHRDLKPGNVMLTKSGVKLLDFGLAKVIQAASPASGLSVLATQVGSNLTQEGSILGTFQYMAPEQLEGKEADVRSDIFSFGAVLYEMATGRKAFSGASQASLISAIMREEPAPIATLQPMTSPALDRVVKTCLAKDPEDRFQTAHDAKLQLQWIAESGSAAGVPAPVIARRKNRERLAWVAFAVAALAAALFGAGYLRRAPRPERGIRATLPFPEKFALGEMALSPDGTRLAFTAAKPGLEPALWVRDLGGSSAQPVAGAESAYFPFWSPDSRSIGFFADGKLKRVDASGGAILTICDAERGLGGTWNRDGTIVFAPAPTAGLFRVAAGGGKPAPVTKLDAGRHETAHRYPQFLPDGRHFLYMAGNLGGAPDDAANAIRVGSLDGSADKVVVKTLSNAGYASGYLLYGRDGTLLAQPFDTSKLEVRGDPVPAVPKLAISTWHSNWLFSASENGTLVTAPVFAPPSRLVWLDRNGKETGSIGEAAPFGNLRLSPDGRRVAADVYDPVRDSSDIGIYDAAGGTGTKFVFGQAHETNPVWSPDGSRIAFASDRKAKSGRGDVWIKPLDGAREEILAESEDARSPEDWSRDGRFISCNVIPARGKRNYQLWIIDTAEKNRVAPFVTEGLAVVASRFSPDGRWLAYASNESGRFDVYVRPFPSGPGTWQVSTAGGGFPVWRSDGKELFFISLDFKMMAAPVSVEPKFHAGAPAVLFPVHPPGGNITALYDVSPDGQRFIVNSLASDLVSPPLDLFVHWTALLPKN